jgi:hypothetical protein
MLDGHAMVTWLDGIMHDALPWMLLWLGVMYMAFFVHDYMRNK